MRIFGKMDPTLFANKKSLRKRLSEDQHELLISENKKYDHANHTIKIIQKIKKLMALSESNNPFESELATAMPSSGGTYVFMIQTSASR